MSDLTSSARFRLFIAIQVPDRVKDELEKTQARLRHALPGSSIRWTKRDQFHLTLKFLGNVDAQRVGSLIDSLRRACRDFSALNLQATRVGFFPDQRAPRVIWVGVQDDQGSLAALEAAIESAVAGFTTEEAEGKFTGHVTLGRCKTIRRPHAETLVKLAIGMADKVLGAWTVDKVELVRSELTSAGPCYTVLERASLLK